jgi:hypothetical protein
MMRSVTFERASDARPAITVFVHSEFTVGLAADQQIDAIRVQYDFTN